MRSEPVIPQPVTRAPPKRCTRKSPNSTLWRGILPRIKENIGEEVTLTKNFGETVHL